jgi:hypothetical protein
MILNFIALAVMLAAIVTAAVLLRRSLRSASPTLRCGKCGSSADAFESFTCPSCGFDARGVGLLVPRRDKATTRFWRFVAFTTVIAVLLILTTHLGEWLLPPIDHYTMEGTLYATLPNFERIDVSSIGRTRGGEVLDGKLVADLYRFDGPVHTWQIDPRTRRDFNEDMVRRWFEDCGFQVNSVNGNSVNGKMIVAFVFTQLRGAMDPERGRPPRNPTFVWGSASASRTRQPPTWLAPASIIAWSMIWIAGLPLAVSPRARSHEAKSEKPVAA